MLSTYLIYGFNIMRNKDDKDLILLVSHPFPGSRELLYAQSGRDTNAALGRRPQGVLIESPSYREEDLQKLKARENVLWP